MIRLGRVDLSEITFVDVEADRGRRVIAIGAVRGERWLRIDLASTGARNARATLERFVGAAPIAGHNLIEFDLPLLRAAQIAPRRIPPVIDTLILAMLAEPARASHALDKSKIRVAGAPPDPIADARCSREVLAGAVAGFAAISPRGRTFYASLLRRAGLEGTAGLVSFADASPLEAARALPSELLDRFCRIHLMRVLEAMEVPKRLLRVADSSPIRRVADSSRPRPCAAPFDRREWLALALAVRFVEAHARDGRLPSPPGPALSALPRFTEIVTRLLGPLCPDHRCLHRDVCAVHRPYAEEILRRNFDLDRFRPHQEEIIHAVLSDERPLAILPTGGGKSLCYQLPAVHGGERLCGLTVVISPLQALMADQVRSLSARYPPACAVNSLLLLEDRRKILAGLRSGAYNVLYIGPEQLRNPSILRLLENRPPFLWVIDEAHCVSQWGHGFRTDYTYLPRAIDKIHSKSRRPLVALFTATATAEVKRDIAEQMRRGLGIELREMDFGSKRENLTYEVVAAGDGHAKRVELVNLLSAFQAGSRLVYCATVRTAREVAEMLREQGIPSALYHGKLEPNEKSAELERFLSGQARTVVATSAFGMGIDKPDIRLVAHYDLPGSLEDYVQETGRAGRDGKPARCVLLFSEDDLETQFYLKTAGRVTARDVRHVFLALGRRAAREPLRPGGKVDLWITPEELFAEERLEAELDWSRDVLDGKLKLVLYHLEADGVLERLENRTRVLGIEPLCKSLEEARKKLPAAASPATLRVLEWLYQPERPREISVLDVADECGIGPREAFLEIQTLGSLGVIGQDLRFDLTFARGVPRSTAELCARYSEAQTRLFDLGEAPDDQVIVHLRSAAAEVGRRTGSRIAPHELLGILQALRRSSLLLLDKWGPGRYRLRFEPSFVAARDAIRRVWRAARAVVEHVDRGLGDGTGRDLRFELDVNEMIAARAGQGECFTSVAVVEACLLLHHLEAWHLSDPPVMLETALKVRFDTGRRAADLDVARPRRQHEHDLSLVHLLREYAILLPERRERFLEDYFRMPREDFVRTWLPGRDRAIARPVGPATEQRILEGLTVAQRAAVADEARALLVVAGPGSGKTHTVVRRVEHMIRARQVRPADILVLAFNRAAAAELRSRLEDRLGTRGRWVDVRTFHSLALKLTGADLREEGLDPDRCLDEAIRRAAKLLEADGEGGAAAEEHRRRVLGNVRHVLVDEYQDLDADQYALLSALVGLDKKREGAWRTERSVYVVGDDDQAIYGFRSASVEFMRRFETEFGARRVCLTENFRSSQAIVAVSQSFVETLPDRMKTRPEEQMRAASAAPAGAQGSVRRIECGDPGQLAACALWLAERGLRAGASIAILGRHWADLDALRGRLEAASIPFTIHQGDRRRPLHRVHPVARLVRELWETRATIAGPAGDYIREILVRWKRPLDERPVVELMAIAAELDADRIRDASWVDPDDRTKQPSPIDSRELADAILIASRDRARSNAQGSTRSSVHLCTYHGAKGLEFDRVVVLPTRAGSSDPAGELRAFYVALTRARSELVALSLGNRSELGIGLNIPTISSEVPVGTAGPPVRYLDCDPSDVRLSGIDVDRAQDTLATLREGDPLELDETTPKVRLLSAGRLVGTLSAAGQSRVDELRRSVGTTIAARIHEIYEHVELAQDGTIRKRSLVVLPTLRIGAPR